jgi:tetratricopeptide (TPR) repeat protein
MMRGQTEDPNWKLCKGDDPERSIPACTALIQSGQLSDSQLAEAYYSRGLAYGTKNDLDQSILDHTQALQLNPKFAEAFYRRANALLRKGNYAGAIFDYDEAIRLKPGDANSFYGRGIAYVYSGKADRGIEDYDEALSLNPGFAKAFYGRGFAHAHKRRYDLAIRDYSQAVRLDKNLSAAYDGRSLAYAHKANYVLAVDDYAHYLWLTIGPSGIALRGFIVLIVCVCFGLVWKKFGKRNEQLEAAPEIADFESSPVVIEPQMPDAKLVEVKAFGNRLEAELAKGMLESADIPAMMQADTAGAMRDHLAWSELGFRLFVRETDESTAREILAPLGNGMWTP